MVKFLKSVLFFIAWGWSAFALTQEIPQSLVSKVQEVIPGIDPSRIKKSPVSGIYEVMIGTNVLYFDREGKFIIKGDIIDISSAKNITELRRGSSRLDAIRNLDEDGMIVFSPDQPKYEITIFTDVDCPYCRRLHSEVRILNKNGIAVRYLAFPRTGIPSPGYNKMVSVWCSDNPMKAMTDAKSGKTVESKKCDNPVAEHYELGIKFAIRGTPTIILENGEMLGGYVPADRLISKIRTISTQMN